MDHAVDGKRNESGLKVKMIRTRESKASEKKKKEEERRKRKRKRRGMPLV